MAEQFEEEPERDSEQKEEAGLVEAHRNDSGLRGVMSSGSQHERQNRDRV